MSGIAEQMRFVRRQEAFRRRPVRTVARLAGWRARASVGMGGTLAIPHWDLTIEIPAGWSGLGKLLWAFGPSYERELAWLVGRLRPGDVFVDVGANIGLWTLAAARAVGPRGRVVALEPAAATAEALERNVHRNVLPQVTIRRAAAADRAGTARLSVPGAADRATLGLVEGGHVEDVATVRLDDVVADMGLARVHAIKIDVEGAEALVLRGAPRILAEHRPVVAFETNARAAAALGLPARGAWEVLGDAGYRFFSLDGDALVSLTEPPVAIRNVLALPEER